MIQAKIKLLVKYLKQKINSALALIDFGYKKIFK